MAQPLASARGDLRSLLEAGGQDSQRLLEGLEARPLEFVGVCSDRGEAMLIGLRVLPVQEEAAPFTCHDLLHQRLAPRRHGG